MELNGRHIVVTGGASGIGAALCRRFAEEGARGIVVADRDLEGADRVAREIGGFGVQTDVASEDAIRSLVAQASERFGAIDLFCSNAGVALGTGQDPLRDGPFAGDALWRASFDVNLMAHVYAARAVLPAMLARRSGWLLQTASAAGLLTDLASAAYSVTKHAAVAFAEWLSIRYGDDGIGVSCLCPQGVRTPMLETVASTGLAAHLVGDAISAEAVAEAVVQGLRAERFLILPHPEAAAYYARRAGDTDRWLAGMRRLRARLYSA